MVLAIYRLMYGHNHIYVLGNIVSQTSIIILYGLSIRLMNGHNHIYGLSEIAGVNRISHTHRVPECSTGPKYDRALAAVDILWEGARRCRSHPSGARRLIPEPGALRLVSGF
jgi:hypothetical protein